MRSVSSEFLAAVRGSHQMALRATVLATDGTSQEVPLVAGDVTLDVRATVRGRLACTIASDPALDLVPSSPSDLLAPYGNELQVERGVVLPTGPEYVSLGVFRIEAAEPADEGQGTAIRVEGLDRSQRMIDSRFEEPYTVTEGTNYATAILECAQQAWPAVPYSFDETSLTTPTLFAEQGADRWEFMQRMAEAIGMRLYFDGDGILTLTAITEPTAGNAVADLVEGEDGVLLAAKRRWERGTAYNRWIVTGENTGQGTPVQGVATDDDPASPTYYYGNFGRKPKFLASQFITTTAQAEAAAAALRSRERGTTNTVSFGTVVDPSLEPDDVVFITRTTLGIDEAHAIDQITVPLDAQGGMTGTTRATQVV